MLTTGRRFDHFAIVALRGVGNRFVEKVDGIFLHQSRWRARLISPDDASRRIDRLRPDPCCLEGAAIGNSHVATGSRQVDLATGSGFIQIAPGRLPVLGHALLVVTSAQKPRARRKFLVRATKLFFQRVDSLHPAEIEHRGQEMSQFPNMHVGIVEAGDQRATAEIDAAGSGAD